MCIAPHHHHQVCRGSPARPWNPATRGPAAAAGTRARGQGDRGAVLRLCDAAEPGAGRGGPVPHDRRLTVHPRGHAPPRRLGARRDADVEESGTRAARPSRWGRAPQSQVLVWGKWRRGWVASLGAAADGGPGGGGRVLGRQVAAPGPHASGRRRAMAGPARAGTVLHLHQPFDLDAADCMAPTRKTWGFAQGGGGGGARGGGVHRRCFAGRGQPGGTHATQAACQLCGRVKKRAWAMSLLI